MKEIYTSDNIFVKYNGIIYNVIYKTSKEAMLLKYKPKIYDVNVIVSECEFSELTPVTKEELIVEAL